MNEEFQLRLAPCRCQCITELVRYCGAVFFEYFGVYLGSPVTNAFTRSSGSGLLSRYVARTVLNKHSSTGASIRFPFKIRNCS